MSANSIEPLKSDPAGCQLVDPNGNPPIMWTEIATILPRNRFAMRAADQILDETFLEVRAKLLEVAATLDRIDRSADEGAPLSDDKTSQRSQVDEAIRICLSEGPDRAERLQKLFSREYESGWRKQMQI
jgi:hypothetical protein